MKFALAKKLHMTELFDKDGRVHAVTVIDASASTVVQIKTVKKDGYSAIQVGFGSRAKKNINKPLTGHMKDGAFELLKEIKLAEGEEAPALGNTISGLEVFAEGDEVVVSGITKGKGFQGGVKRYNFKGGPRSHGQKHSEREPGSLGGGGRDGGRVAKGKRMAGRMGGTRITVKGLKVVALDKELGVMYIQGAVPGRKGTLLEIQGK